MGDFGEISQVEQRTLLAVFAHPDDESFGIGEALARYAAEGVRVVLACATLGEPGEIRVLLLAWLSARAGAGAGNRLVCKRLDITSILGYNHEVQNTR